MSWNVIISRVEYGKTTYRNGRFGMTLCDHSTHYSQILDLEKPHFIYNYLKAIDENIEKRSDMFLYGFETLEKLKDDCEKILRFFENHHFFNGFSIETIENAETIAENISKMFNQALITDIVDLQTLIESMIKSEFIIDNKYDIYSIFREILITYCILKEEEEERNKNGIEKSKGYYEIFAG